jgi:hypothetical protein
MSGSSLRLTSREDQISGGLVHSASTGGRPAYAFFITSLGGASAVNHGG